MPKPKPESFVGYRCKFREIWEADILAVAKVDQYGVVTFTTPDGPRSAQPDHLEHIVKLHPLADALVPPVAKPAPAPTEQKPTPPAQVKRAVEKGAEAVREVVRQASADILTADSVIPQGVESLLSGPTSAVGIQEEHADLPPCVSAPRQWLWVHLSAHIAEPDAAGSGSDLVWISTNINAPDTPKARAIVRRALNELSEIE
jgi:hypothetical protein